MLADWKLKFESEIERMRKELQQKLDASRELLHDSTSEQRRLAALLARSEEKLASMNELEANANNADERLAAALADADLRISTARVCYVYFV